MAPTLFFTPRASGRDYYRGNIDTSAALPGPGNTWPSTLMNTLSSTEKYSVPLPAFAYISTS